MIDQEQRWIFVHIQKTGGNAIRAALGVEENDPHKHFFAADLKALYGAEVWDRAFKFAIVRNPWDRLVSWWSMIDGRRALYDPARSRNQFFGYVLERAQDFRGFLLHCDEDFVDRDGRKHIFRNQIDYVSDESGRIIVDYIGRFEALPAAAATIADRIGRPDLILPVVNRSAHRHYTDYYTPDLIDLVADKYRQDIEIFGYRFGE
jgi:predicted DCC family thiol-disulfide oxidoreductase YuxK